ncbi:MAG: hypothetical protein HYW48_04495 [Deltaproteobacteria bacterium]|nr:hypothetical protein [Deltaproteobacteria bacterium]
MTRARWSIGIFLISAACGGDKIADKLMPPDGKLDIARLEQERNKGKQNSDVASYAQAQLKLNHLKELEGISDTHEIRRVNQKYELLGRILEEELTRFHASGQASTVRSFKLDPEHEVYESPEFTSVYHPITLQEVRRVFTDFGELYVNVSEVKSGRPVTHHLQVKTPWSGYWYPFGDNSLYRGDSAPLIKFDQAMKALGHPSRVADDEEDRYKGMRHDGWEGLCDAVAKAAVLTDEPKAEKVVGGVKFSIADQKALLTFANHHYPKNIYGRQYRGDAETDGTYQDIKPEAFHKIVEKVLGDEKRAIIIDDVAGVQVWNKPLFQYRWKIEQDPDHDYVLNVKSRAFLIKERSKETDELTSQADYIAPSYDYRLYVDKRDVVDGKFRVIAGQWIKESYRDHPDTVTYPLKGMEMKSHNDEFNKYIPFYKAKFVDSSN